MSMPIACCSAMTICRKIHAQHIDSLNAMCIMGTSKREMAMNKQTNTFQTEIAAQLRKDAVRFAVVGIAIVSVLMLIFG